MTPTTIRRIVRVVECIGGLLAAVSVIAYVIVEYDLLHLGDGKVVIFPSPAGTPNGESTLVPYKNEGNEESLVYEVRYRLTRRFETEPPKPPEPGMCCAAPPARVAFTRKDLNQDRTEFRRQFNPPIAIGGEELGVLYVAIIEPAWLAYAYEGTTLTLVYDDGKETEHPNVYADVLGTWDRPEIAAAPSLSAER